MLVVSLSSENPPEQKKNTVSLAENQTLSTENKIKNGLTVQPASEATKHQSSGHQTPKNYTYTQ